MNAVPQNIDTERSAASAAQAERKGFNIYPLIGLGLTILCAALTYGCIYLLAS